MIAATAGMAQCNYTETVGGEEEWGGSGDPVVETSAQ